MPSHAGAMWTNATWPHLPSHRQPKCHTIVRNPEFHERTKHIEVKYYYIRDRFKKRDISVHYINTKEQVADIFTKYLAPADHQKFKVPLGVFEVPK